MTITYDSSAQVEGTAPSVSVSHTLASGSDRIVIAWVHTTSFSGPSALNVLSCTYNGVQMIPYTTATHTDASKRVSFYYLRESQLPAAGTYTAAAAIIPSGDRIKLTVASFAGVKDNPVASNGGSYRSNITFFSTTITVPYANAALLDAFIAEYQPGTQAATFPQVEESNMLADFRSAGASHQILTTPGVYSASWTGTAEWPSAVQLLVVLPADSVSNALFFGTVF